MKKNIISLLIVLSMLVFTSCGSNSKTDPTPNSDTITKGYYFSETENTILVDSYRPYKISFILNKDGFVLPNETVRIKSFDSNYGTVTPASVVTDENGKGKFIYHPPTNMPASGTTFVLQYVYEALLENGSTQKLTQDITLNFNFDSNTNTNGRATTLSVSYLTTTCDIQRGIIGHYNVHAADPNSREPIVGLDVSFSLINGVTVLSGKKVQRGKGTINNTNPITFKDSSANFSAYVTAADNLIIMPTQGKSDISYMGGWNIVGAGKELQLAGTYNNIQSTNSLTYIIGNEQRLLGGKNGAIGIETVAHVEAVDATTDSNGFAYFDIVFDPHLGGHTVVVEAHGDENGKRFGIAKKEFLRLDNFSAPSVEILNTGGIRDVYVPITIEPGCVGNEHLIDVPVNPSSFSINPVKNCAIVGGDFLTNSGGSVKLEVATDGNFTASEKCTITWEGGPQSLQYEY